MRSQKMKRNDVREFRFEEPYRKKLVVIFRKFMDQQ